MVCEHCTDIVVGIHALVSRRRMSSISRCTDFHLVPAVLQCAPPIPFPLRFVELLYLPARLGTHDATPNSTPSTTEERGISILPHPFHHPSWHASRSIARWYHVDPLAVIGQLVT